MTNNNDDIDPQERTVRMLEAIGFKRDNSPPSPEHAERLRIIGAYFELLTTRQAQYVERALLAEARDRNAN